MYKDRCGHNDNGRVKTWLPYRSNRSTDLLLHDVTQEKLLGDQADKYYVSWYQVPEVSDSFILMRNIEILIVRPVH